MKTLLELQKEISAWASATFKDQNISSKMKHLTLEVKELADDPTDGEEMADCLILLANLAEMSGLDLFEEAEKKMAKNRLRTWSEPDEHGVCRHIK